MLTAPDALTRWGGDSFLQPEAEESDGTGEGLVESPFSTHLSMVAGPGQTLFALLHRPHVGQSKSHCARLARSPLVGVACMVTDPDFASLAVFTRLGFGDARHGK